MKYRKSTVVISPVASTRNCMSIQEGVTLTSRTFLSLQVLCSLLLFRYSPLVYNMRKYCLKNHLSSYPFVQKYLFEIPTLFYDTFSAVNQTLSGIRGYKLKNIRILSQRINILPVFNNHKLLPTAFILWQFLYIL